MTKRLLRFHEAGQEESTPASALTPQQRFVSEARAIIAEVGGEVPHPGVLGLWKKKFFGGSAAATLHALNILAALGAIRNVGYTAVRIASGIREGLFYEPVHHAPFVVGQVTLDGRHFWDGNDWSPIPTPGQAN